MKHIIFLSLWLLVFIGCTSVLQEQERYPESESVKFVYSHFPENNQQLTWQDFPKVRQPLREQPAYELTTPVYICTYLVFSRMAEYGDHLDDYEELTNRLEIFINSKPINKENYSLWALPQLIIVDMGDNGEHITTAIAGDYCWNAEGFIDEGVNEVEIYFHKTSGAIVKQSWVFEIIEESEQ